jgi:hypothetical protein
LPINRPVSEQVFPRRQCERNEQQKQGDNHEFSHWVNPFGIHLDIVGVSDFAT